MALPMPMRVNKAFGMIMMRIAVVRVVERSLAKRKQEARDETEMENPTHALPC